MEKLSFLYPSGQIAGKRLHLDLECNFTLHLTSCPTSDSDWFKTWQLALQSSSLIDDVLSVKKATKFSSFGHLTLQKCFTLCDCKATAFTPKDLKSSAFLTFSLAALLSFPLAPSRLHLKEKQEETIHFSKFTELISNSNFHLLLKFSWNLPPSDFCLFEKKERVHFVLFVR